MAEVLAPEALDGLAGILEVLDSNLKTEFLALLSVDLGSFLPYLQ